MKRVLLLSESSIYTKDNEIIAHGGGEVYFHNLAKLFSQIGFSATVLSIQEFDGQSSEENIDGVNYKRLPIRSRSSIKLLKYLKAALDESKKYDLVVFNQFTPHLILPFVKKKKIGVIHDVYQDQGLLFWIRQYGLIKGTIGNLIEKLQLYFNYRFSDKILTVSQSSTKKLAKILGEKIIPKIVQVPYQVNLEDYETGNIKENFILFVGRFVDYKNPEHILYSLKEIKKHHPTYKAVFIVARTEKKVLKSFNNAIEKLSLNPGDIILKHNCTSNEVKKMLSKAAILVQPSYIEGQGIIVLEALASRTPVVAYDLEAYKGTLIHGKNSLLAKLKDSQALAKACLEVLKNYDEYRSNCHLNLKRRKEGKDNIKETYSNI